VIDVRCSGGAVTISDDGVSLAVKSGRVIIEGRRIWHSPGAEFVVRASPRPFAWLRRSQPYRVYVLSGAPTAP
jgi:hypothetical protein